MVHAQLLPSVETPRVSRSIQIRRPAIALYTAWHHLSQRPTVPLGAATPPKRNGAPLPIKAPGGHTTGRTFIQDRIHGRFIAWSSELASGVTQSGEVWFHDGNSDLDCTLSILLSWDVDANCDPAQLCGFNADVVQLDQDLHRFKSLMER